MTRLSISRAWEETAAFVARETTLLVPLALALIFLPSALVGLAMPAGVDEAATKSPLSLILFVIVFLVSAVGQLAIARLALGHREQLGASISHAAKRMPSLLGALMLVGLPFSIALGLVMGVAEGIKRSGAGNAGLALVVLLFMTVLLVAILIVTARCLLMLPTASVEPGGPIRLIRRSMSLTKRQVLRLLVAGLLFLIGGVVVITALTSVVGAGVTFFLGRPEPWTVAALLIAVAAAAAQSVLATLFTVFTARLYAQRADVEA